MYRPQGSGLKAGADLCKGFKRHLDIPQVQTHLYITIFAVITVFIREFHNIETYHAGGCDNEAGSYGNPAGNLIKCKTHQRSGH